MKIIEGNVQAAMAVLQHYAKTYGTTGAEAMQRMAVLSMYACLIGRAGGVASDFRGAVNGLTLDDPFAPDEKPLAGVLIPQEEHDRNMAILGGIIFDSMERNMMITEDAASIMRGDGDFPEPGIFVPFTMATAMVEKVMQDATKPDTIIGKHVRESIAAEETAEQGDGGADGEPEPLDDDTTDDEAAAAERRRSYGDQLAERTKSQLQSIASDLGVSLNTSMNKQEIIDAVLNSPDVDYDGLDASLSNHPAM